jgi:glycosyltransferase involved in cell wall biosynthesis
LGKDKINLALFWSKYSSIGTSLNDLILRLDKDRFNVIFIYLTSQGVDKNLMEEAGYKVFYLSNIEMVKEFRFSILFRLIKILKENNIDILHCHRHKPSFYGALAGIFVKTPVILSHVHGLNRTRNIVRRVVNFFLFRRFNRIISCAKSVQDDVLRGNRFLSPEKVSVMETSVDYERFADVSISKTDAKQMLGLPSDVFVFGTVGRLAHTKGLSYLIEAFSKVKEKIPSAHLVLFGDGDCRAELEQQASNLSCRDSIHFLGHRDNIEQLMKGMDIFILSSIAEGMPRAILEAMASGIPCIATEAGGIPEIINSPDVGLLVPPMDENALAEAMITLANTPKQKLKDLIENARERVLTIFNHDVVTKKLENTYEIEMNHYFKSGRFQKSSQQV